MAWGQVGSESHSQASVSLEWTVGWMDGQMNPQMGVIPFPDGTAEAGTGRLLGPVGYRFQMGCAVGTGLLEAGAAAKVQDGRE